MRSILVLAISLIMIQTAYAENTEVETLRVSGSGACMPYHATYSPNTAETLIDFSIKPFDKVLVLMKNAEGFEKKVEATPYSGLMGFKGAFSTANVRVGKCSFTLSHAPQVNELAQDRIQSASVKADEARLLQIQQQMNQLISVLSQNNNILTEPTPQKEAASNVSTEPVYPTGVVEKPVVKVEPTPQPATSSEAVVIESDEWQLVKPVTNTQPLKTWKFEKDRHSVLLELEKGRGYEVIAARDKKGSNMYKGKINALHRVLLPYMSDDLLTIEVRDLKSHKYIYTFKPPLLAEGSAVHVENSVKEEGAVPSHQANKVPPVFVEQPKSPETGYQFTIRENQYLSNEIRIFLESNFGWKLMWQRRNDMTTSSLVTASVSDLNQFSTWLNETVHLNALLDVAHKTMVIVE
jgi:hypothetical protein